MVLLMNLSLFSQKTFINKPGDTLICFTLNQSKFLLKEHYRLQMTDSLLSVCNSQIVSCDSIKKISQQLTAKYDNLMLIHKDYTSIQASEISLLNETINSQKKLIKVEKMSKIIAIIGGGILSGFLGYLLIVK